MEVQRKLLDGEQRQNRGRQVAEWDEASRPRGIGHPRKKCRRHGPEHSEQNVINARIMHPDSRDHDPCQELRAEVEVWRLNYVHVGVVKQVVPSLLYVVERPPEDVKPRDGYNAQSGDNRPPFSRVIKAVLNRVPQDKKVQDYCRLGKRVVQARD